MIQVAEAWTTQILHSTNLFDIIFSDKTLIHQKVYIILREVLLKNSRFWSGI
jgi:hypothetical protein